MRMTLTAPAAIEATDSDSRTLHGIAIPYDQTGHTSAGTVIIDAGAISVPDNLRAVKLFREHGRQVPIGYALEATDAADALRMGFQLARTPDGDQALLEAAEGLRDALSVELNNVQITAGHVTAADLVAVAQVAVPAFAGATLAATLSDDDQADVHALAEQISDKTKADDPTDDDSEDTPPSEPTGDTEESSMTTTQTTEAAASPAALTATMTPARRPAADPSTSLEVYAAQAVDRIVSGNGTTAELNAALQDIIPANTADPGGAFLRPGWLGELWKASKSERPFAQMVGLKDLTTATFEGWQWTLKPKVDHYAGNKTEVPSSPATAGLLQSGPPERVAGAWDVDRIYVDFNTGMLTSFLSGATDSYNELLETDLAELFQTLATPLEDVPTATAAFSAVVAALISVGARADYIAMAPDVFAGFIGLKESEVPWWLQKQGSISLASDGFSADVADLTIGVVAGLEAGTVLGGDRRAVDVRATGPIRVEAVNIPNGGIDVGLFGYMNDIINDARAVVSTHVAAVVESPAEDTADDETVAAKKTAAKKSS